MTMALQILTLLEMPQIKIVLYMGKIFPHMFGNTSVTISDECLKKNSPNQMAVHAVFEPQQLHCRTVTCYISLLYKINEDID